jgi:hypothetical protein
MKTKTWKVITNTGKQAELESGSEKRRFKSWRTLAPESLCVGWQLAAGLMIVPCCPYSSGSSSPILNQSTTALNDECPTF